jgi:predicted nucleic acid-binding Zn ribbon protein
MITEDDRCVCCGEYVPEGRQVCLDCENKTFQETEDIQIGKDYERTN